MKVHTYGESEFGRVTLIICGDQYSPKTTILVDLNLVVRYRIAIQVETTIYFLEHEIAS